MKTPFDLYNLQHVASQKTRYPAALEDGYAPVDDSSFEQLLAYSAQLSRLYKFVNLELQDDGDWGQMFRRNEAVIVSEILSYCSVQLNQSSTLR